MSMNIPLRTLMGVAIVWALTAGCDDQDGSSAEGCSTSPSIVFEGHEYTEVAYSNDVKTQRVEVGARIGVGETASSCGNNSGQRVRICKVVGVPVERAVFAMPVFGLMARSNLDATEPLRTSAHARCGLRPTMTR